MIKIIYFLCFCIDYLEYILYICINIEQAKELINGIPVSWLFLFFYNTNSR